MTLLLSTLPGSKPTFFASVYCPPHHTQFRQKIPEELDLRFNKYPSHVTGVNFNAIINTSLDSENIVTPNHWPWLSNTIHATLPQLTDTFRSKHPNSREFNRYWSQNHQNQARLVFFLASPNFTPAFPILDANIDISNFLSDHPPSQVTCVAPIIPTHTTSTTPGPIFRSKPFTCPPPTAILMIYKQVHLLFWMKWRWPTITSPNSPHIVPHRMKKGFKSWFAHCHHQTTPTFANQWQKWKNLFLNGTTIHSLPNGKNFTTPH